jgi:hypothetical protein
MDGSLAARVSAAENNTPSRPLERLEGTHINKVPFGYKKLVPFWYKRDILNAYSEFLIPCRWEQRAG